AAESEFDVTIVNHDVHAAAEELVDLMGARRPV
ncbi:MAG TPA: guanylate kinase, partial [Brevibacterium sp.]|nr:guanylate kinase [Brevibacterium sp.]